MTISPLASASATRDLLEEFGLATKHRLGQNFLIDNHVIERICELAELDGSERVLEVGPGIGTLTLALLQEAEQVVSIEADPELEPVLAAHAADYDSFTFLMGDALKVKPELIMQAAGGEPSVFVANLPYNVAATIILQLFETMPALTRAVVMVQKEVADRISAAPGNKTYGGYTAKLGLYGEVTGRFEVPPRCFMPDHRAPLYPGLHAVPIHIGGGMETFAFLFSQHKALPQGSIERIHTPSPIYMQQCINGIYLAPYEGDTSQM